MSRKIFFLFILLNGNIFSGPLTWSFEWFDKASPYGSQLAMVYYSNKG
jgi:hypothetical protein